MSYKKTCRKAGFFVFNTFRTTTVESIFYAGNNLPDSAEMKCGNLPGENMMWMMLALDKDQAAAFISANFEKILSGEYICKMGATLDNSRVSITLRKDHRRTPQ